MQATAKDTQKQSSSPQWSLRVIMNALKLVRAPLVLMVLVFWLYQVPGLELGKTLDLSEDFAGEQAVSKSQWESGFAAAPFEIRIDGKSMDFMSDIGYCQALSLTLKLKTGAGKVTAPVHLKGPIDT
jgi:hypothetical protein